MPETSQGSKTAEDMLAELKEKYLRVLTGLPGCHADISLVGSTKVSGTVVCAQQNSEHFIMRDLNTPTGTIKKAILRAEDIEALTVNVAEFVAKDRP